MNDPLNGLRTHARRPAPDLAGIVERGRRRRQTRVIGAGLATAAVGAVVALAIGGSVGANSSSDRLLTRPDDPASAAPTPTASQSLAVPGLGQMVGSTPGSTPSADATEGAGSHGSGGGPQGSTSEEPAPPVVAAPTVDSTMHRAYDPDHATVELTSGQLCTTHTGASTGNDPYCAIAGATTRKPGVVEVSVLMCRDGSQVGDGTLTFDSDREVDFAVYRGSALLWRWSDSQDPASASHHVRAVARGKCWVWWTQWAAVDDKGHPLTGTVTVRATSNASEVAPTYRTTDYEYTL